MEKFGRWPFVVLGFVILVSTIYQYGFWSAFGLNVFQYFNPSDIIKNFIYVLISSIKPLFIYMVFMYFDDDLLKIGVKFERKPITDIFGPDGTTTWGKLLKKVIMQPGFWVIIILGGLSMTMSFYGVASFESYPKLLLYLFVFALALLVATSPNYDFLGMPTTRWTFSLALGFSILTALQAGRADARKIINGEEFFFSYNNNKQVSDYSAPYFKLVARAGEQTAFISSNNKAIILLNSEQMSKITLLHDVKKSKQR